jgi:hypothetical protein
MRDYPAPGTDKDAIARQGITGDELAIYERLVDLPHSGSALVTRRVDPVRGQVLGWTVTPIGDVDERNIRQLANHRVLLLTDRVLVVDGLIGQVSDNGPFDWSLPMSAILATSDGETLILVQQAESEPR